MTSRDAARLNPSSGYLTFQHPSQSHHAFHTESLLNDLLLAIALINAADPAKQDHQNNVDSPLMLA
jgi:hypothetical protein